MNQPDNTSFTLSGEALLKQYERRLSNLYRRISSLEISFDNTNKNVSESNSNSHVRTTALEDASSSLHERTHVLETEGNNLDEKVTLLIAKGTAVENQLSMNAIERQLFAKISELQTFNSFQYIVLAFGGITRSFRGPTTPITFGLLTTLPFRLVGAGRVGVSYPRSRSGPITGSYIPDDYIIDSGVNPSVINTLSGSVFIRYFYSFEIRYEWTIPDGAGTNRISIAIIDDTGLTASESLEYFSNSLTAGVSRGSMSGSGYFQIGGRKNALQLALIGRLGFDEGEEFKIVHFTFDLTIVSVTSSTYVD
jgi:hypothetical protein